jgi:chromosomal replication initiation ATPase DnaA
VPARDQEVKQLAFDLPYREGFSRADFFVSAANAAALDWVDRWPKWPSPVLLLHGPRGAGKTHLAHLWCERASAVWLAGKSLAEDQAATVFDARNINIVIEDAHYASESALLHLLNACLETGRNLLLTSSKPPADWHLALPDLGSRLRAIPSVAIGEPDDALLGAVLTKHFADRQVRVAPEVITYLLHRIERSFAAAERISAALDRAALDRDCAITIPLANLVITKQTDQSLRSDKDSGVA